MGFLAPDVLIEETLRNAINNVVKNADELDEMLQRMSPATIDDIKGFLRGRNKGIRVIGGWPSQEQQVPCVTVQLRPENEAAELQSPNELNHYFQDNARVTTYATLFRAVISMTCYGNNQKEATYLALIVKWALLVLRFQLEEQGLMEQSLSISDFEPIPAMFDETTPWFLRTVQLSATYMDTWEVAEKPIIANILVSPYSDNVE